MYSISIKSKNTATDKNVTKTFSDADLAYDPSLDNSAFKTFATSYIKLTKNTPISVQSSFKGVVVDLTE